jgi:hypothetical protein
MDLLNQAMKQVRQNGKVKNKPKRLTPYLREVTAFVRSRLISEAVKSSASIERANILNPASLALAPWLFVALKHTEHDGMKRRLSVTTSKSPTSVQPNPSEV